MYFIPFSSDDFCIETITSKDNTVHAIVNKKFLSRYQVYTTTPSYPITQHPQIEEMSELTHHR